MDVGTEKSKPHGYVFQAWLALGPERWGVFLSWFRKVWGPLVWGLQCLTVVELIQQHGILSSGRSPLFTDLVGTELPKQPLPYSSFCCLWPEVFKSYYRENRIHMACSHKPLKILLLLCWLPWIVPLAEKWVIIVENSAEFEPKPLMLM